MNYINGKDIEPLRIESIKSYVNEDTEVILTDKTIDSIDIESIESN